MASESTGIFNEVFKKMTANGEFEGVDDDKAIEMALEASEMILESIDEPPHRRR